MLAVVWRHVRMRIFSFTGTFIWERTGAFLRSPRVMGTTLRGLRMADSRLMHAVAVQAGRFFLWERGTVTAGACGCIRTEGWMKRPHTDVGQKENHMPLPNSKETTFPHSEEQSLRQQVTSFEEWRTLAG